MKYYSSIEINEVLIHAEYKPPMSGMKGVITTEPINMKRIIENIKNNFMPLN